MAGTSAARVEANRNNALKSTGPRTAEGKAKARANAVKHGLTGAGVALPSEDAAMVEARFVGLQEELAPRSLLGMVMVQKVALLSIRVERAAQQESAFLAPKVRRASVEFEIEHRDEIDRLFDGLAENPRENHRRLLTHPEGVDKLSGALQGVRHQLEVGIYRAWDDATSTRVEAFFGGTGDPFPMSRTSALLEALEGRFEWVANEVKHLDTSEAREAWAVARMIEAVDEELEALAMIRDGFDLEAIEQDRLGAADRALFDTSTEAERARKYAGAATRGFFQALREYRKAEAEHVEAIDSPSKPSSANVQIFEPNEPTGEANVRGNEPECRAASSVATLRPSPLQNEPNPSLVGPSTVLQNEPNSSRSLSRHPSEQPESGGSGIMQAHF